MSTIWCMSYVCIEVLPRLRRPVAGPPPGAAPPSARCTDRTQIPAAAAAATTKCRPSPSWSGDFLASRASKTTRTHPQRIAAATARRRRRACRASQGRRGCAGGDGERACESRDGGATGEGEREQAAVAAAASSVSALQPAGTVKRVQFSRYSCMNICFGARATCEKI